MSRGETAEKTLIWIGLAALFLNAILREYYLLSGIVLFLALIYYLYIFFSPQTRAMRRYKNLDEQTQPYRNRIRDLMEKINATSDLNSKLVRLAKTLHCPIVSNDYNLNRVAGLQGVKVLNINELANAVKPVILPGEELTLRVVQEGKEPGQGIGFLDDGTMVVIEGGRRYLNTDLNISITRVLQTAAGRMIFAQPKESIDEKSKR